MEISNNFKSFSEYNRAENITKATCIFNIPHSSISIPTEWEGDRAKLADEILLRTDWEADKIFNIPNSTKIVADVSRLFCDMDALFPQHWEISQRHADHYRKKDKLSYKDMNGNQLSPPHLTEEIYQKYYFDFIKKFSILIKEKLEKTDGDVHIINCHTFSSTAQGNLTKGLRRPDVCLSTDDFHTPWYLAEKLKDGFEAAGLTAIFDEPYKGTIVPEPYHLKDQRVKSIRIEINRGLYMDEKTFQVDLRKVLDLNKIINSIF